MPHPSSPHRHSPDDVPVKLESHSPPTTICASEPPHSQLPLSTSLGSSVPPSLTASTMATAFTETALSQEQQPSTAHMEYNNDASSLSQWPPQYDLPLYSAVSGGFYPQDTDLASDYAPGSGYIPNGLPYAGNYNIALQITSHEDQFPRSYPSGAEPSSSVSAMQEFFPPSAYLIEPQKPHDLSESQDSGGCQQLHQVYKNKDYEMMHDPRIKVESSVMYTMASDSASSTRCSTPHDEPPRHPSDFKAEYSGDDAGIDKEQPYAQLIWKALMGAEGHTMILRDIYTWFKENTDKTDKETKGWQNSIRHNLSMNGAFEKVDQPGEDARKGFMWKLTDEAVRDGVKSTTRYRSKQPSKRNYRSGNPQPQRQASGAKGGQAAKRSARFRRANRGNATYNMHRSEPFIARSVPSAAYSPAYEHPDTPAPFPASPYFGSESEFGTPVDSDGYASPFLSRGQPLQLPTYTAASYQPLHIDSAYIIPPADPQEPLFYDDTPSNTSSPPADEPLTPESPTDWGIDPTGATHEAWVFDDYTPNYHEMLP